MIVIVILPSQVISCLFQQLSDLWAQVWSKDVY
jgi:hypothetical protein